MAGMLNPINFVTGTLGSGKSYFAMRYVREYLAAGKIVACNFDLRGDFWRSWMPKKVRREPDIVQWQWMRNCRLRALRYDVPEDLYDYRLPGEGEDRGLLVIDEGGLRMNSRAWQERKSADKEKYGKTAGAAVKSLELYINMRKLGWSCLILAHSQKQLDNQVQDLGGAIIRLRNFQRVKMPLVGVPLSKHPKFLAIHLWPEVNAILKRELYGLDLTTARHYQSMETFDADPVSEGLRLQSDLDERLAAAYARISAAGELEASTWQASGRELEPATEAAPGAGRAERPPAGAAAGEGDGLLLLPGHAEVPAPPPGEDGGFGPRWS